jgi:hypothetical protein
VCLISDALGCIVSSVVMLQLTHTSRAALPDASANPADFLLAWRERRQTRRPKGHSACPRGRQPGRPSSTARTAQITRTDCFYYGVPVTLTTTVA